MDKISEITEKLSLNEIIKLHSVVKNEKVFVSGLFVADLCIDGRIDVVEVDYLASTSTDIEGFTLHYAKAKLDRQKECERLNIPLDEEALSNIRKIVLNELRFEIGS